MSDGADGAVGAGSGIWVIRPTPTPVPYGEFTGGVIIDCIIPGGPRRLCMLGGGTPIGTLGISPCAIDNPIAPSIPASFTYHSIGNIINL